MTTKTKITVPFGLNAAIPEDATVAWGGRFIIDSYGMVDLPPDRCGFSDSPQADKDALREDLITVLPDLTGAIRALILAGDIDTRVAEEIVIATYEDVTVVGNSNGSAGYFYLAAFRVGSGS